MSPTAFNERLAEIRGDRVRLFFRTAHGFPQVVKTFPKPDPIRPFEDPTLYSVAPKMTRVELHLGSGATFRCSCHDIEKMEGVE